MIWRDLDSVKPAPGLIVRLTLAAGGYHYYQITDPMVGPIPGHIQVKYLKSSADAKPRYWPHAIENWRWAKDAWSRGYLVTAEVGWSLCPKEFGL